MRASTLGCRFLDRCGCRLGVEISFKDMCILAAVLTVDAEVSLPVDAEIEPQKWRFVARSQNPSSPSIMELASVTAASYFSLASVACICLHATLSQELSTPSAAVTAGVESCCVE
eukprot:scaffold57419_cov77-Phaeocystis_antarctica.AAC.1